MDWLYWEHKDKWTGYDGTIGLYDRGTEDDSPGSGAEW